MSELKYAYRVFDGEQTICCGGISACARATGVETQYFVEAAAGKQPDYPYSIEPIDPVDAMAWILTGRSAEQDRLRAARERAEAEKREAAARAKRRKLDCKGCRYLMRISGTSGACFCDRYLQAGAKPELGPDGRCRSREKSKGGKTK